jgi:hypothetical protein
MDNSVYELDKKAYVTPQLVICGNIEEITQAELTNQNQDFVFIAGLTIPSQGSPDCNLNIPDSCPVGP